MPAQSGLEHGDHIGDFTVTGRVLVGPASDLVELDSDNGLRHTAVVFHPEYRGHPAIGDALSVVLGFLESPMVTGLVELVGTDRELGAFVYPTGEAWSVAEVIRQLADFGEPAGVRAGLELMYAAGQILVEAADAGDSQGVYSHGGLTPWRIMLKRDGQVLIIGHALPQVEILQFHEDSRRVPREDSFRYCPPERIEAAPEDLSSDLFGLALIAFELMTGKPVYDGLVNDIRQQAARAEGSRRLFRFRQVLPQSVRDVLTYALRPEREDRYPSGDEFLESVRSVLSGPDATGPSLMDVMQRVSTAGKRTGTALEGGKTQMLSKEQILAMLEEEEGGAGIRSSGDGVEGRSAAKVWSPPPDRGRRRSRRRSRASGEGDESPAPTGPPATTTAAPAPSPSAPSSSEAPPPPAPAAERSSGGGGRWSKVTRGPRAARSRRSTATPGVGAEAAGDGLAGPSPVAAPKPVEPAASAAATSSADRARDLLAAIRASADTPASSPPPLKPVPRAPAPTAEIPETGRRPRFEKGRARRSRRSRTSGDGPPPLPSIADRLSASTQPSEQGDRAAPAPPVVPGLTSEPEGRGSTPPASAVRPSPSSPRPVTTPPARATEAEARPDPAAAPPRVEAAGEPTPPPAPVKADAVAPATSGESERPPAAAPASVPVAGRSTGRSTGRVRPPDPIPSEGRGEPVVVHLQRGAGQRVLRLRLPAQMTTAEAVARLVGHVLPIRTDLRGGLRGWWRLSQDGARVAATTTVGGLSADRPVLVEHVPNEELVVELRVSATDPPARFLAAVGTAVPAVSLCDHLAAWMDLPPGRHRLLVDGRALGPHEILADHLDLADAAGARPVVELRGPER